MIDQVTEQLAKIQLKDEDVATYIAGIVEDESMDDEEKREVIAEFLSETTDENTDKVIESILLGWKERQGNAEKARAEEKAKALEEIHEREKARQERSVKEMQENAEMRRNHAKQLTKEERTQRERLMQQYGYDSEGVQRNGKGETEVAYKDRSGGSADPLLSANRNADIIKEQDQKRREQLKKQSDAEKERNKMLLERQRLKDEKDKRKTVKKEKRRM